MRCATRGGFMVERQNHPAATFTEFGPQKLVVAVLAEIRGGTWRHHEGCVVAKQLCVERMAVRSKSQELVHFTPVKWIGSMYLGVV
jgi:hypothetical protein